MLAAIEFGYLEIILFEILMFVASVVGGTAVHQFKKRIVRKTIDNWEGRGVHRDLPPLEAALLLAEHPSS
ncbi:MAG: hypothetical protein ACYTAF_06185, partial [Planctomycetota bacterium]